jgi:hypothetical protein
MLRRLPDPGGNHELVDALVKFEVRFLIVGGLAIHYHVPERKADDLDLLLEPSLDTARKVIGVLLPHFPGSHLTAEQLAKPRVHLPLKGKGSPFYADILTPDAEMNFAEHWERADEAIFGTHTVVKVASIETILLRLSQVSEPKHVRDIELLKRIKEEPSGDRTGTIPVL